jgi:uncharacterized protein
MKADRVVCDSSVLISAAIAAGKPRAVLQRIRDHDGRLLISKETFLEFSTRLKRQKFDRYVSTEARQDFLNAVASLSEVVVITGTLRICRDETDDKFLETAITGQAAYLITSDKDLLSLRPAGEAIATKLADTLVSGVAIVTAAEFLGFTDEQLPAA